MDVKKEKQPGMGPKYPRMKNSQGGDPRTHERKSSAKRLCPICHGLIVRAMEKDAIENPMRAIKVEKLAATQRKSKSRKS